MYSLSEQEELVFMDALQKIVWYVVWTGSPQETKEQKFKRCAMIITEYINKSAMILTKK